MKKVKINVKATKGVGLVQNFFTTSSSIMPYQAWQALAGWQGRVGKGWQGRALT